MAGVALQRLKRSVAADVRRRTSSNLYVAHALNRVLGAIGSRRYLDLVELSEASDPFLDVTRIAELRLEMARRGATPSYPNRIESVNRIYGIKSTLFGDRGGAFGSPSVEHGLFLGNYIYPADTIYTAAPSCVTFSEYRRQVIQDRQSIPVFTVGPYIQYARAHLSEDERSDLKAALGRTLVVFPSHTTEDSRLGSADGGRQAWIESVASDFNSVIVCVFWWNLLDSEIELYRALGYKVVSCGLTHDRRFLSRLKTVLALADLAIGDGIGTHVGYCVAEGVPFRYIDSGQSVALDMKARSWMNNPATGQPSQRERIIDSLKAAFSGERLGGASLELARTYWGVGRARSTDDLALMVEISEEIARRSRGCVRHYAHVANRLLLDYATEEPRKYRLLAEALPRGRGVAGAPVRSRRI